MSQHQMIMDSGSRIPVTELEVGPCPIVQVKTLEKDGYEALQLGFGTRSQKSMKKPLSGHVTKTGKGSYLPRFLREIPFLSGDDPKEVGNILTVGDVFAVNDAIAITGVSKGKGFAGVVKRHGFRGGPKTHGQSDRERAPGSIGQTTTPGRVYKGKRMAGRMGGDTVTIQGLKVIAIDPEKNTMTVKGLVPGNKQGLVMITKEV